MLFAGTTAFGLMTNWDRGGRTATIPDGSSNTMAFVEKVGECNVQPHSPGSLWAVQWDPWYPIVFGSSVNGGEPYLAEDANILPIFLAAGTNCDPWRPSTPHPAIQVGLADGAVRDVAAGVSQATWWSAAHPADGHPLGPDW
jgi:hypothetical protein